MRILTRGTAAPKTPDTSLTLSYDQRIKSRLRIHLDNHEEAGIFIDRGSVLNDGDYLESECGLTVVVKAADEPVSTAYGNHPLMIALACYHLGNRHVPVQITENWVRYQSDHVLDDMVQSLGLEVKHEMAPFSPENGAYSSHQNHHHHHEH